MSCTSREVVPLMTSKPPLAVHAPAPFSTSSVVAVPSTVTVTSSMKASLPLPPSVSKRKRNCTDLPANADRSQVTLVQARADLASPCAAVDRVGHGGPVGAAVGGHLAAQGVVVDLDVTRDEEAHGCGLGRGQVERTGQGRRDVVAVAGPPLSGTGVRGVVLGHDRALGQRDDRRLLALGTAEVGPVQLDVLVLAERDGLVVQPAELELLPRTHVAGR